MMKRHLLPLLGAVAALSLAGASAQAAVSSSDPKQVYELGRCIVKTDRDAAIQMLRDLPVTGEATDVTASMLGGASKCMAVPSLEVSSTTLRGAVAQGLVLRDFPRFGVPPKISESLFARFELPVDPQKTSVDGRTANLYKLADCVARNQGIKLERLFRAEVGSDAEGRLFDAISPYIAACQGNGGELRVSRTDFRSLLAQAFYNVSVRYWTGELWSAT